MGIAEVGLIYDERMCAHENSDDPFHPEKPARITSIFQRLEDAGIVERCQRVEARDATPGELGSVHTEDHIIRMCALSGEKYSKRKRDALARRYSSVFFNEGSSTSALLAAGSVVEICLRVARGDLRAGAAVVRPPGHHAEAGKAMGFCLFNNVAVAAHVLVHGNFNVWMHHFPPQNSETVSPGKSFLNGWSCLQPQLGVRKVLIVDWDIHHGNGTQHMFWNDPHVLYFSIHRHDFGDFFPAGDDGDYDKVGGASAAGFNINVPWPHSGFGDLDYLAVFEHLLMPVAEKFNPDMVLVSGGFDSAAGDPLGRCEVTPAGYSQMTSSLMGLANGRVVLALEGGYNLKSISDSYLACMKILLGEHPEQTLGTKHHLSYTIPLVQEVRRELEKYWPVLSSDKSASGTLNDEDSSPSLAEEEKTELPDDTSSEVIVPTDPGISPPDLSGAFSSLTVEEGSGKSHLAGTFQGSHRNQGLQGGRVGRENSNFGAVPEADFGSRLYQRNLDDSGGTIATSKGLLLQTRENPQQTPNVRQRQEDGAARNLPEVTPRTDEGKMSSNDVQNTGCDPLINAASQNSETRSPGNLASLESSSLDNPASSYVWYACYGSNMCAARFICYIQGGQIKEMKEGCVGANNSAPPLASCWQTIPYDMFFGYPWNSTWGVGGAAFLDPVSHGGAPSTLVRLYKITLEQFRDLLIQENIGTMERTQVYIDWKDIDTLRGPAAASSHATMDFYQDSWYGAVKYLGEKDGLPILTVTCTVKDMQKFREGKLPITSPSDSYKTVILKGLREQEHLSEEECIAYLASKLKGTL